MSDSDTASRVLGRGRERCGLPLLNTGTEAEHGTIFGHRNHAAPGAARAMSACPSPRFALALVEPPPLDVGKVLRLGEARRPVPRAAPCEVCRNMWSRAGDAGAICRRCLDEGYSSKPSKFETQRRQLHDGADPPRKPLGVGMFGARKPWEPSRMRDLPSQLLAREERQAASEAYRRPAKVKPPAEPVRVYVPVCPCDPSKKLVGCDTCRNLYARLQARPLRKAFRDPDGGRRAWISAVWQELEGPRVGREITEDFDLRLEQAIGRGEWSLRQERCKERFVCTWDSLVDESRNYHVK